MPGLSSLSAISGLSGIFAGGFKSSTVDGLQLWLKADAGTFQDSGKTSLAVNDGDVIGAWEDQSGNGNDATQSTTANKPLLKLNIMNGKPVIRFDGIGDYLATAVFAADLSHPLTFFVVVLIRNAEGVRGYVYDGVLGKRNALFIDIATAPDEWDMFAGVSLHIADVPKNTVVLANAEYNGVNSEFWENSISIQTGNTGGESLDRLVLGIRHDFTLPLDCDIGEVLLYNATLSTSDRQTVENYLNARYAIF